MKRTAPFQKETSHFMRMRTLIISLLLLLLWGCGLASTADAQVIVPNPATASVSFASPDQGSANLTGYQGFLFRESDNVATATPLITGPVISKSLVAASGVPSRPYKLTLGQLGVAGLPACTVTAPATCPAYTVLLVGIGPGGASPRSTDAESDSFSLPAAAALPPAGPTSLRIQP
jgi:hypothetical protein